jgi:hypothetical protein
LSRDVDPTRRLLAPRKRAPKAPPQTPQRRAAPQWWRLVPLAFLALAVGLGGLWAWRSAAPAPAAVPVAAPAAVVATATIAPAAPVVAMPSLSVAELLRAPKPADWRVARMRANPSIVVIEFPGLTEQGRAMNRLAAMFEKRDGNRERVLTDAEMGQLLRSSGDSVASFYQGHDYTGEMVARFFSLAAAQRIQLNAQELRLRALLVDAAVLQAESALGYKPLGTQAVISFTAEQDDDPTTDADETVDGRRRESVLLHELSHGEYFTNAAYRAHCRDYWRRQLTERERQMFRHYLDKLDYNPRDEELMVNETQAVLMNTPDSRAFNAAALSVSEVELARLRGRFRQGDPRPAVAAVSAR